MWIEETAKVLATIAAVLASISIICKTKYINRPIKWIWAKLISDPMSHWIKREATYIVEEIVNEKLLHPNNGSSLYDLSQSTKALHDRMDSLERTISGHLNPNSNDSSTFGT